MSRLLRALEAHGTNKIEQHPDEASRLRAKYGMPLDISVDHTRRIIEEISKIDSSSSLNKISATKGIDLAFRAIDILRGEVEPEMLRVGNTEIAKPMVFKLGCSGLAGYLYARDEFLQNRDDIQFNRFTELDLFDLNTPREYCHGERGTIIALPQNVVDTYSKGIENTTSIAFGFNIEGYDLRGTLASIGIETEQINLTRT